MIVCKLLKKYPASCCKNEKSYYYINYYIYYIYYNRIVLVYIRPDATAHIKNNCH